MPNEKPTLLSLLAVHAVCVIVIVGTFVLAGTVLKGQPLLGGLTVAAGAWLWGKLGFRPAQVVLERVLVSKLGVGFGEVEQLVRESARPPAPPPPIGAPPAAGDAS